MEVLGLGFNSDGEVSIFTEDLTLTVIDSGISKTLAVDVSFINPS